MTLTFTYLANVLMFTFTTLWGKWKKPQTI